MIRIFILSMGLWIVKSDLKNIRKMYEKAQKYTKTLLKKFSTEAHKYLNEHLEAET